MAELEWTHRGEPRSLRYDDCYFSAEDGQAETEYVFIQGSNLEQRLGTHSQNAFTIAELGFGTGLNFLMTWACFNRVAAPTARLHYWSVDRHPLSREALIQSLQRWPQLSDLAKELLNNYPPPLPGVHRRILGQGRITLDLVWAEAMDALPELSMLDEPLVDAWYLDGFSPRQNKSMWTEELYTHLSAASKPGATFATYSAAGAVRRNLDTAGFAIAKRRGFGSKRECLQGVLSGPPRDTKPASALTPWDLLSRDTGRRTDSALVLGAGLAGAHVAAALARRGMKVTVLDQASVAAGGSGNPQGVLFTRLSHERSILGEFSLLAFLYAKELYRDMFKRGSLVEGADGSLNGCLQVDAPRGNKTSLGSALQGLQEVAESCDAETATELLGTLCNRPGLWQPGSGWLAPPAVCHALLQHKNITVHRYCGELQLAQTTKGNWEARTLEGSALHCASLAVLATGPHSRHLAQTQHLPLRVVRGQTTQIPAPEDQTLLRSFCHRGYISPAVDGEHCIGATFKPGDESRDIRIEEHQANLEALAQALPDWAEHLAALNPATLEGRAELRCVSPDYLPVAGPLPDEEAFRRRFAALQWDASEHLVERGAYLPGLYISTAHGSRGLSYAALSAELIAAQVFNEAIPVSRELQRALSPARFIIRGLIRGAAQKKTATA